MSGPILSMRGPEQIASSWQMRPEAAASGLRETAAAALWRFRREAAFEVESPPDPASHLCCVVLSGNMQVSYSGDGRERWRAPNRRGTFNIVRPGEKPRSVVSKADALFLHFHIHDELVQRTAADICSRAPAGMVEIRDPSAVEDRHALDLAQAIAGELSSGSPATRLLMDAWALQMSVLMVRRWSNLQGARAIAGEPGKGGLAPWQVKRVAEYLEANLSRDVSLGELAGVVHLSPAHFCRAYKEATGKSPIQALIALRIERAKALLSQPRLPVIEVAAACGYESPSAFATTFRRATGLSPQQWRRERLL